MLKFTTLTPGTVRPLDGRWTFTMVVDGVEEPAIHYTGLRFCIRSQA